MIPNDTQQIQVHDLTFQPFLSKEAIAKRVQELGKHIAIHFLDKNPVFIAVLNGSFIFAADLMRACSIPCEVQFVRLSSYEGTSSTGTIKTVLGLNQDLEGRHLIIVEDIVDTGITMHHFLKTVKALKPASVSIATLLLKPDTFQYDYPLAYVGFEIPNKFVVGYGLDYNEYGRNLGCLLYTSPSPRDGLLSRMPSSA